MGASVADAISTCPHTHTHTHHRGTHLICISIIGFGNQSHKMPSHPPSAWDDKESVSRTMLYKKITKPLLERQRRARINRCLDELKELMSAALASEGENLTKLEKADVLDLTVRHLPQLHREGELTLGN